LEEPFRQYLSNTPRLDEQGELNLLAARAWLEIPTVSAICIASSFDLIIILQNSPLRKLKAVDSALAKTYDDRVMRVQEIVELAVQEFERLIEQREKERKEAIRIEEEQKKAAAEAAQREKERLEEEKGDLVKKMRALVEQDPALLEAAGFIVSCFILQRHRILTSGQTRTTYPAVASGTCEACAAKKITCTGIAGRSCNACHKLHASCSNSTGKFIFFKSHPFLSADIVFKSEPSNRNPQLAARRNLRLRAESRLQWNLAPRRPPGEPGAVAPGPPLMLRHRLLNGRLPMRSLPMTTHLPGLSHGRGRGKQRPRASYRGRRRQN
jgi:hypothetical protein